MARNKFVGISISIMVTFLLFSLMGISHALIGGPVEGMVSDSKEYYFAKQSLASLKKNYNDKNLTGIMELISFSNDEKQRIKNSLVESLAKEETEYLNFYIEDHSQFFSKVTIFAEWDIRTINDNNKIYKKGKAKFNFKVKDSSAKLISIKGDSPF